MPYLALNGVTIPTAKGGSVEVVEVGDKSRAFDGTLLREVRNFKRKWKFRTKPISELRGLSIAGLLQGRGYYNEFENDLYSKNGLPPTNTNILYRSSVAADGATVYDDNGVLEAYAGSYSVCAEGATTTPNKFTAGIDTASTTTGFTAINGGAIAVNTSNYWVGTSSLRVTASATASSGVQTTTFSAGGVGLATTFSVYVKGSGGAVVVSLVDNTTAAVASTQVTVASGVWRRISVSATAAGPGAPSWFGRVTSTNPGSAQVFYIDGLQLEANAVGFGFFATSWVAAGVSKLAGNLSYNNLPTPIIGAAGMTVNFWMTQPYNSFTTGVHWAADFGSPFNTYASISTPIFGPLTFQTDIAGVGSDSITAGTSYTGWHMVTGVLRTNPETGEFTKYLYSDGALQATSSAAMPNAATYPLTYWGVGNRNAASQSYNRIDEMQVLPYPVDANTVSGWFASYGMGDTPFIRATGDFAVDTSVTVVGQVDSVQVVGYKDGSTWRNNGCVIEFTLEEI